MTLLLLSYLTLSVEKELMCRSVEDSGTLWPGDPVSACVVSLYL